MVEYCFETVNWSPYLGFERPDLLAMVGAAAGAGYRWISFDLPSLAYHADREQGLHRLRAAMSEGGIGMLAIHSLAIGDHAAKTEALAREACAIGRELGARYLHAGVTATPDDDVVATTRVVDAICRAADMALAIEFLPFLPLATIGQTQRLLDAAGLTGRNLVIDSWHYFNGPDDQGGAGWATLDSIPAARIAYVQFNDHGPLESDDLLFETTQNRLIPGAGRFDLAQFASRLRRSGFDGIVGPEVLSSSLRDLPIEQTARRLIEATKPYWMDR